MNWDAAVFYCFSVHCDARGGPKSLERRVRSDTPSYRQDLEGEETQLSGDNLRCSEAATERLAAAYERLGLRERAEAVRGCRRSFRVGKCMACARTPAYPLSCGDPFCVRCMPGRLAADWQRHGGALPGRFDLFHLVPRDLPGDRAGILKRVRSRFREWRARAGIRAGIYGVRWDRQWGAVVLLAIPAGQPWPQSSRAFEVRMVAEGRDQRGTLRWLQAEYGAEAQSWESDEELAAVIEEVKGRRRFQGFGAAYGEAEEGSKVGEKQMEVNRRSEKCRKPLNRVSGGSLRGRRREERPACPFCGGAVELYPFPVPADQVEHVGGRWRWRGPGGGSQGAP